MKLTYRDKVILIALAVIAVWAIGIMYFIRPKFEDLDSANKDYDKVIVTRDKKKSEVDANSDLKERVEKAYNDVTNIAGNFYDKMDSKDVANTIDGMLDKYGITNTDLAISAYSSVTLAYIVAESQAADTELDKIAQGTADQQDIVEDPKFGPVDVPAYTLQFNFNCKFEDLQAFVDSLPTNTKKSLVVTTCTIDDINEEVITGDMTMVLMMMPKLQNPLEANNEKPADGASE